MTQPDPAGGAIQNTWIRVLLRGVLSVTATGQLLINCVSSSSMIYGKPAENKHIKMSFALGRLLSFRVDTSLILFLNLSFCVSSSRSPDTRIVLGIQFQSMLVELTWGQGFDTCSPTLSGTRILCQHFEEQATRWWSCSFHSDKLCPTLGKEEKDGKRKSKANTLYIARFCNSTTILELEIKTLEKKKSTLLEEVYQST